MALLTERPPCDSYMQNADTSIRKYQVGPVHRIEAPTTDHLRDYAPNLEKCKALQFFPA